uniref:Mediator of RNA polymerase II transcription subunit 9 n=1 Tax=Moniliophthora roreri TaxID=221103 RepID=A0A0W0F588_MONRR
MSTNSLPTALFQSLLSKLVVILELTQNPEGIATPQGKQAILQATNDFKASLMQAKELASSLPGGDLLIEDQDDVIDMLVTLRDRKRDQLADFSNRAISITTTTTTTAEMKMEIDSMASTPLHES